MSGSLIDSGTTSALTLGTETALVTDTTNFGAACLEVEVSAMVLGDLLEIRFYDICLSGGTLTQVWYGSYQHVQINNHKLLCPVPFDQSMKATLLQRAGQITITTLTGTIADGTVGTGQTTGATALIRPAGAGNVSGTTTGILMTGTYSAGAGYTAFNSSEIVWCTTVSNKFTMNAAPTSHTYPWKILKF